MLGQKSDTSKKNASSTKNSDAELNKSKRGLVKGPKPLQRLKFYLDIKNHAVTSKLEEKIKELGGAVEFFLDREVTHVISDRTQCQNNTNIPASSPATPRLRSADLNNSNESPNSAFESPVTGRLRQKTRADAMLEKVRSQSTNKVRDPLQNAKLWGIPIWNVNKILSWLEKVSASITVSTHKKKTVKVININSPFLKFEPVTRNARPVYKTIKSWPTIDLDSNLGKPAFIIKSISGLDKQQKTKTEKKSEEKNRTNQVDPESANDSRMTRKQRTRLSVRGAGKEQEIDKQALVGGFCEICHCEYREIAEHVRSEQHLNFIKNDANFLELDSLISAGANVEAFLRLNGTTGRDLNNYPLFCRRSLRKLNDKTSPEKCNGSLDVYSPPVTRNKMPRTRNSQNSLSPMGSDTIHHLRSRGQIWLPNNLIGTTAEDELYVNNKKERSKSNRITDDEIKITKENESERKSDILRPKRACPKSKRISADERLVADNKTYYKVEVMTTKLRSSGLGTRETEVTRRVQTPIPEEEDDDDDDDDDEEQGLVVKFKRVRRSELSVLNDEAENFMFPRKEDPSFSDMETDEGPNTTKSPEKTESSDIRSSESEMNTSKSRFKQERDDHLDESSATSYESEILPPRRKRRCTEMFKSSVSEDEQENSIDNFVSEIGLRRKKRRTYTEIDETIDDSSKDGSTVCESENGRKKRRRTHAEMFITDNQRYYKFETPGSRLRYQGVLFSNLIPKSETLPNKNNGECSEQKPLEIKEDETRAKMPKDDLTFSFEFLPKSEPWYQTFKRQDVGDIIYTCTSDPGYCTNFFLPYQLPFIIPIDPKVCISEYQKKKQTYLNQRPVKSIAGDGRTEVGETSASVQEPTAGCSTTDATGGETTSLSTAPPDINEQSKLMIGRKRKRKSRFLKMNQMHPRKSPRQHASTLAILSSLIHQRKKRERKSNIDSDTSRTSLPCIPEEEESLLNETRLSEEEQLQQEQEQAELTKAIDDILNIPLEEEELPQEIILDDIERIEIKHNQDCIQLIDNFDKEDANFSAFARRRGRRGRLPRALFFAKYVSPSPMTPVNTSVEGTKSVRRKRKKNRTGWPKKKRLFVVKKEGMKKKDSSGEKEELSDSNSRRLKEISIEKENGELEMCETDNVNNVCASRFIGDGETIKNVESVAIISDKEHELNENKIQGVSNLTERINNLNNSKNFLECNSKTNNILAENLNNNSDKSTNDESEETILNEKNNGVVVNNLLMNKKTSENITNDVTVVPDASQKKSYADTKNHDSNTMIKVSVSTDFSSNKVPASPKKSDTVYSVTILDCKKSVVDGKKVDSCEEVGVKDNWETAGRIMHFQPIGRVQKIENSAAAALQNANRRLRSSSSPSPERKQKNKKIKIVPPTSPRSPRKLRAPRGKWYRER